MYWRKGLAGLLTGFLILSGMAVNQPGAALAAEVAPAPQRTLEVTGRGMVTVKPDVALINLGVTALKETAGAAYETMAEDMAKIAGDMAGRGVKASDIKTGVLSLQAEYDWNEKEGQRLKGYRATNNITIKTRELEKVGELVQAAVASGANQLAGVTFTVEDTEALQDQALDLAVDDAKARAERVATRLGTKVAGVYRVAVMESGGGKLTRQTGAGAFDAARAAAPVFGGTSDYTVTVNVTFELSGSGAPTAETAASPRTLDLAGRGTVTAKYDTATINLGVMALKETAGAAFEAMATDMNGVVKALQAQGVKESELKTGVLSLQAEYDWVQNQGQRLRGYRAANQVIITTQHLDKVAELVQAAVTAGANQLNGVTFSVKDTDALMGTALDAAVDDARAKADRVAARLGTSLAGVVRVTMSDSGPSNPPPMMGYAAESKAAGLPAPLYSGDGSEVTAVVNVTFELK